VRCLAADGRRTPSPVSPFHSCYPVELLRISCQFVLVCARCRLESVYRLWVQERSGGDPEVAAAGELRRELHTALGTAKWQVIWMALPFISHLWCFNLYGSGLR
jgi:hypothetical protein